MKTATLGDVATWGSGGTPKRGIAEYFGPGTPWLSIADLNDSVVESAKESLTAAGLANSSAKIVPEGTIFIAMYGSIGKLGIAASEMATSQAIAFAQPRIDVVDRRYLFHYLLAQRPNLQALGRGGTQMNIGQGDLKAWPIPLPPLEEQRRLAAILDRADAIRTKRRQVLTRLDSLTGALFDSQFGSLSATAELQDVCLKITDGTHQTPEWETSGVPFLFVSNITSGEIDLKTKKYISVATWEKLTRHSPIEVGDVLYSTVGSFGVPALVRANEPFAFQRHIAHIKPDRTRVDPSFLAAQMSSPVLRQQAMKAARGVAQPTVNLGDIKKFRITVPPMAEQREFAANVDRLRAHRIANLLASQLDEELFASLQSRAFRGEL